MVTTVTDSVRIVLLDENTCTARLLVSIYPIGSSTAKSYTPSLRTERLQCCTLTVYTFTVWRETILARSTEQSLWYDGKITGIVTIVSYRYSFLHLHTTDTPYKNSERL